jgi:Na+-translocating ferredoxin:NAD+ oxidoreductase RnfC subunit
MNIKKLSADTIRNTIKTTSVDIENWGVVETSEKVLAKVKLSYSVDSDTSIHFLKDAFSSQVKEQIVQMVDNEELTEDEASDFIKTLVFECLSAIANGQDFEKFGVVVEGIAKQKQA